MNTPITYIPGFITNPDFIFQALRTELSWERRENTPRYEYYCNDVDTPYTYGSVKYARTYNRQPYNEALLTIKNKVQTYAGCVFEVCFLNRYKDQSDHLGWHADDSPEMDDNKPIAIVSFGVEREIWFTEQNNKKTIEKVLLQHGSLCLMHLGMQDTHFHRIPKASRMCGERISLTFRGFVQK